jgi:tetratricopeptide (TPR) repeat protein
MEELGFPDRHYVEAVEGWLGLGDASEAAREFQRLSPEGAAHPVALEMHWRILSAQLAWPEALRAAQRYIEVAPQLPAGWIHQSYSLHELRRTDEAFQFLHAVVLKFPEESVIPYNLACYACQMGQLDVAQRWLNQAVRIGGKASVKGMAEDDADLKPLWPYIESL